MSSIIFNCKFCKYKTNKKFNLNRHITNKHIDKIIEIEEEIKEEEIKEEEIEIEEEIKEEEIKEEEIEKEEEIKEEEIYNCVKCDKNYKTIKYFNNHQKNCNGLNILSCSKCMFIFTSRQAKSNHIKKNNCIAKSIINNINNHQKFINNDNETKELIYKIGKTKQENLQRIKSYPNGSILLLYIITNDCDKKEKLIIQKFKEHFIHKKDIGNEYFMGDYNHMINIILSIISISNESSLIESSSLESSSLESSLIESSSNDSLNSIVYFDYDNKIINFDNSHIKDIEFIKNDKLYYYELFELYYNKLFENENNKIIKKTNKSYSKILTKTNKWINKLDECIYPIIINNIAKNMKSFIEINFKDDINDYTYNKDNIDYTDINYYIINILYKILCFLDFIIKITSKNENLLFRDLNKYISIINYKNYLNEFDNYYKLNIKQLKLLFTI